MELLRISVFKSGKDHATIKITVADGYEGIITFSIPLSELPSDIILLLLQSADNYWYPSNPKHMSVLLKSIECYMPLLHGEVLCLLDRLRNQTAEGEGMT